MKIRLIYLFSLSTALIFTSCSNNDDTDIDTQSPGIEIVEPHNEDGILPGGEIHFDALFTDNVELASYKIEIHNDFDSHTHSILKQEEDQDNPWSYSEVFTIEPGRTNYNAHFHIPVPAEINGEPVSQGQYHFGVYVTDAAGNESQAFIELHIDEDYDGHEH